VNDGSIDSTEVAVRSLPVDVRYIRQENAGPAAARNRGLQEASGEFIAFLDVDDLWPAGTLRMFVDYMHGDETIDLVRGRAQVMRYVKGVEPGEFLGNPGEAFPHYIGAGLYRRRAFDRAGSFDGSLRFSEDIDWHARAVESGLVIRQVEDVTLHVRRHDANMTRGKSAAEMQMLRVLKSAIDRRRTRPGDTA
jgi:glycosyltransferase involved in cell wall biosynthesis